MSNFLKSDSTSLFRTAVLIFLSCLFPDYFLYALIVLYLLLRDRKAIPVYVILLSLILLLKHFRFDLFPLAIVDVQKGKYYIADKIFYKVRIETDEVLYPGDILCFEGPGSPSDLSYVKQNILYLEDSFIKISSFPTRRIIYERICGYTEIARAGLYGFLYHLYTYDSLSDISFGIASYYALKEVGKRSKKLCLFLICFLSLCFCFQVKYLFLLIELFTARQNPDRYLRFFLQIVLFSLLNPSLFQDPSILIPVLLNLFSLLETDLSFHAVLFLIQSFLFGEIDLFQSILFRFLLQMRICFYLFSILLLFLPSLESLYICSLSLLEKILSFHLSIRGSPSLWTLLLLLVLYTSPFFHRKILFEGLILLLLLSPLNHPFSHVSFLDVGQGDSAMIRNRIGYSCILIDTGSGYNYAKLKKYLFSQGIYTIDYLIITHDDADHNGNIGNLKKDFQVKEIIEKGRDISYEGLILRYYDLGVFDNDNDNSLVYSLNMDKTEFLFTGDISVTAENLFVQKYGPIDIDVLKVAHHGSDTSSGAYFIGSVRPEYAVISTSGQYGHPKRSVLETLKKYRVCYFNTRYSGTVSFYFLRNLSFIQTGNNEFVIMKAK